jgi:hypothetical protein
METRRIAVPVLVLAALMLASPSTARTPDDDMSRARTYALHECTAQNRTAAEYTWGHNEIDRYRACMARRGETE